MIKIACTYRLNVRKIVFSSLFLSFFFFIFPFQGMAREQANEQQYYQELATKSIAVLGHFRLGTEASGAIDSKESRNPRMMVLLR